MPMKFLTTDNTTYELSSVPEDIEDIRYCVLDYSNPSDVDYIFIPLLFLESFDSPIASLNIGGRMIDMPLDWSVIIADEHSGETEVIPLTKLNDRPFQCFCLNPLKGFIPEFLDITIEGVRTSKEWLVPKLKYGHILSVPLDSSENPLCAYFVRDANKIPEQLDIGQLV